MKLEIVKQDWRLLKAFLYPTHSWLFGVVVIMADYESVGCKFKHHKGLFNFEVIFVIISSIGFKIGQTQLVKPKKSNKPSIYRTPRTSSPEETIPSTNYARKSFMLWFLSAGRVTFVYHEEAITFLRCRVLWLISLDKNLLYINNAN